jgi:putative transposase
VRRRRLIETAAGVSVLVGVQPVCDALGIHRSGFYRTKQKQSAVTVEPKPRPKPPRALSETERNQVLATLNSDRFVNLSPQEVYGTLLDENVYLCSQRTMYRILAQYGQVRERRDQLRHPPYRKPELLATAPNQVWSWDITKLLGPAKWTYFYLYVLLDIYSRYVVGWMVAYRESAELARRLIDEAFVRQGVSPGQLTIHADRGTSMKSKPVALLLSDLGVTKTHSRPYTSNDNPYSEAQFKTLKYRPDFPQRFGCAQDARSFCRDFFTWYNRDHRHSGIALLTPETVQYGRAAIVQQTRGIVLADAYAAHPERFVKRPPVPLPLPHAVWINKPENQPQNTIALH